ncbi:MAG: transketolase [Thermoanaerobaculia bacterium]
MHDRQADTDLLIINTIRFLAVDMVEAAQSGHPGAPLGQAPMGHLLFSRYLRFDPAAPEWPNRDRFVLSCGHASALLYALLHLAGYDLPLDELERFRQLGSRTPGHPEHGLTPGVETTTGPLGQGLTNAVGMAMAERMLAARFNRQGFPLFDHRIFVFASDGDLMEGVTSEASSLAGHLRLGRLIVLYDDNRITIDGATDLAFSEDVEARYAAYGWHVQAVEDGNDLAALGAAVDVALAEEERPSLIRVRTHIGYGAPTKQDTADAHGAPLGAEEARATKEALGWPLEPPFLIPEGAAAPLEAAARCGATERAAWEELLGRYRGEHPEAAAELERRLAGDLPAGWEARLPDFAAATGSMATRSASGKVLNAIEGALPELVGGSADLTGSNNTYIDSRPVFSAAERGGSNLHFGVREHAMGGILSGMALSGLLRPYGGTFLIFSDYMRPAIRLAALMELPVVYVFTHDSIFLGEDGPTHQPISQLVALRAIPNLTVIRPADAHETAAAWKAALERREGPTALSLTRQKLPILDETARLARVGVARGAYVLAEPSQPVQAILIATGSEVPIALEAGRRLAADGLAVRVVSMPSWELFEAQPEAYRKEVLPPGVPLRLAIEAGSPLGWDRYVGPHGEVMAMTGFGASAPWQDLAAHFRFTADEIVARLRRLTDGAAR